MSTSIYPGADFTGDGYTTVLADEPKCDFDEVLNMVLK